MKAAIGSEAAVDKREKNFLTEAETERFLRSARHGRHGVRNFGMMLLAYRHALRVSELVNLRMADLDLDTGRLFVPRNKGSLSTSQPLGGDEIRAQRAWLRQRTNAPCCNSPLLFLSERGPMTRQAVNYLVAEIGKRAALTVHVYPHMLRHSCGYALANKGCDTRVVQDYLGTETSGTRSFTRARRRCDSRVYGDKPLRAPETKTSRRKIIQPSLPSPARSDA